MSLANDFPLLLVIDLEATCDDQGTIPKLEMETIEIGAVIVNRESLETTDEFQIFVKPVRHPVLTEFCTKLTSIQQKDVEHAPLFPEAMEQLTRFIGQRRALFCSWGQYDKNQLAQDSVHHQVELRLRHHLNLRVEFSAKVGSTKRFELDGALEHVGLAFEGTAHRGIDDARNIARLLPWILGHREIRRESDSRA